MERVVGGVLAILMFSAVAAMGLLRHLSVEAVLLRALACGAGGFLIGWLSVGPLGRSVVQSAVRVTDELPPETTGPGTPTEKP